MRRLVHLQPRASSNLALALACTLLAAAPLTSATEICVGVQGICELGGPPAWVVPRSSHFEPLNVTAADTLKFSFTSSHNVFIMVRLPSAFSRRGVVA